MMVEDTIIVVSPVSGGPSEAVGILAGDKIIMIEDSLVAGPKAEGVDPTKLLRGEKGTKVNIQVKRFGKDELIPFTITRDAIPMHSLDAAYTIADKTAYFKLNRFSARTYEEFQRALERLIEQEGIENVILDLRHNPGGYLEQATKILSQFFPDRGKLLVYTEGSHTPRKDYNSNGRAFFTLGDVAVLIDEGSASASEIVAGAIQDHDRGIIIGRRSFGKGLVQEQYELKDGSALRLTVSRYFTPSGRSIQKSYEEGETEYNNDLSERFESGELYGTGKINIDSNLIFYTDAGHPVYGGGGISPDVFVPIDTSYNNETYLRLRQEIPAYVFRYLEQHSNVGEYADFNAFKERFQPGDEVINDLRNLVAEETIVLDELSPFLKQELLQFFKARVAKQLFGGDHFFRIYNEDDEVINKALEILRKDDPIATARRSEEG
ncbi:MAG: S41 family peptidase [Bacteroidota bacterium]